MRFRADTLLQEKMQTCKHLSVHLQTWWGAKEWHKGRLAARVGSIWFVVLLMFRFLSLWCYGFVLFSVDVGLVERHMLFRLMTCRPSSVSSSVSSLQHWRVPCTYVLSPQHRCVSRGRRGRIALRKMHFRQRKCKHLSASVPNTPSRSTVLLELEKGSHGPTKTFVVFNIGDLIATVCLKYGTGTQSWQNHANPVAGTHRERERERDS